MSGAGGLEPAVGGNHIGGYQVVAAKAVFAGQPSDAAPESQSADTGIVVGAAGGGEAEGLGLMVECAPLGPSLGPDSPLCRVDTNSGHFGKVDHQPIVAHAVAGEVVTAASHGNQDIVVAGEIDRIDNVRRPAALGNKSRPLVDHSRSQILRASS